jgi:hypothetical protein
MSYEIESQQQQEAAKKIQALSRGFLVRKLCKKQNNAVIKIQALSRGYLCRKNSM